MINVKKYELREQGFMVEERSPNKRTINILWLVFTVVMIAGTYVALLAAIEYSPAKAVNSPIDVGVDFGKIPVYVITLIVAVLFYFALKLVFTLIFCRDKNNSTRLKMIEDKNLPIFPVCFCREAFTAGQTVLMYVIPVIITYALMFLLCVFPPIDVFFKNALPFEEVDAGYMTILFFTTFFMAFDLTLISHVLYYKIKDKTDYVSVEYHVYGMTLFRKTFVRLSRKRAYSKYLTENSKYIENGKFKWRQLK